MRKCIVFASFLLFYSAYCSVSSMVSNVAFTALDQLLGNNSNGNQHVKFKQFSKLTEAFQGAEDQYEEDDVIYDDDNEFEVEDDEDQDDESEDRLDDDDIQFSKKSNKKRAFREAQLSLSSSDCFFPDNRVIRIAMSENGNLVAMSYQDGTVGIKNLKTGRLSIIQADNFGGVRSMNFAGNNHVLYTYSDTEKHKHLVIIRLDSKTFQEITPVPDSKHIRVYGKGKRVLIFSPTDKKHFLHILDTSKLDRDISEESQKKALKEVVSSNDPISNVVVNSERQSFIYVTEKNKNKKLWLYEGNEGANALKSPGRTDQYISIANNGVIYKIAGNKIYATKKNGTSVLVGGNVREGTVNVDGSGIPYFVTCSGIRMKNIPIGSKFNVGSKKYNTAAVINAISKSLGDRSWRVVDTSQNNRYWLVKVTHPMQATRYVKFDIVTSAISVVNTEENQVIHSVMPFTIAPRKGYSERDISGFVTFPSVQSNKNAPTILCLRRTNDKFFSWELDSQAQYLADRGFIVVCINQGCDNNNSKGRSNLISDVSRALGWLSAGHNIKSSFLNEVKSVPAVRFNKVVLVSNCKNADSLLRKFSSQNFKDKNGKGLAGVCFVNPQMPKNAINGLKLPTLVLPSIISSQKASIEGHNISVFSLPSNEEETRASLLYQFAAKVMNLKCNNEEIDTQRLQIYSDDLKLLQEEDQ